MWRIVVLLAGLACALGAAMAALAFGPSEVTGELAAFARVAVVAGLLGLAAFLPLVFSMNADRLRLPWRAAARLLVREAPIEAAVLVMLSVSVVAALWFVGAIPPAWNMVAVIALGALGAAAASVQHLWGYAEPREG